MTTTPSSVENTIEETKEIPVSSRLTFSFLWGLTQLAFCGSVLLLYYWINVFDTGLAWHSDRKKMLNLHAFSMLTGFVFFNGQAIIVFKTFICFKKFTNKMVHTVLLVISIALITFGLYVGIKAQGMPRKDKPVVHFYSLHSWTGLLSVGLFVFQFIFGFISFLVLFFCEKSTISFRERVLPLHKTLGLIVFTIAVATCLSGLLQTARARLSGGKTIDHKFDYAEEVYPTNPFSSPGLVINMLSVCLIAVTIFVPFIVIHFNPISLSSGFYHFNDPEIAEQVRISHLGSDIQSPVVYRRLAVPAFDWDTPVRVGQLMIRHFLVGEEPHFQMGTMQNLLATFYQMAPNLNLPPLRSLDQYLWEMLTSDPNLKGFMLYHNFRRPHPLDCTCNERLCTGRNFRIERNVLIILANHIQNPMERSNPIRAHWVQPNIPNYEQIQILVRIILNVFRQQFTQYFHERYEEKYDEESEEDDAYD